MNVEKQYSVLLLQRFVDHLVKFYYHMKLLKSDQPLLADCSRVPRKSRRLVEPESNRRAAAGRKSRRLVHLFSNLMARRNTGGLCPIIGQLERLGGPAKPSRRVPRLRPRGAFWYEPPDSDSSRSNRVSVCTEVLKISRELSALLSCMHKFYRRCTF